MLISQIFFGQNAPSLNFTVAGARSLQKRPETFRQYWIKKNLSEIFGFRNSNGAVWIQ
jgi:hypothetical protein